jgi:branched-chain amino acid transport system ATP-binding protein
VEALRVERLSREFGGVQAVKDVSFGVEAGEHMAIIGPNGAGKTTLFNLLCGQLPPSGGRVFFFGQDVTNLPPHKRTHLGMARSFQIASLFLDLTVLKNTLLAFQGKRPSRFQMFRSASSYRDLARKAEELLGSMGLWEKRYELANSISYGEQRKLEIALSLASEPKVLLLDEPSCGLTASESADITSRIRNLGEDITVILVAHDMDLVFGVAQRIIVLHYGVTIIEGNCEKIRTDPKVRDIYMGSEEISVKCSI